jgi:DnaJ family protein C protein 19
MDKNEAALILNVRSSKLKEINESHGNLIQINHPDRGGSPYIAQKINEARKILLREARG